jgi:hypothetical protein
VGLKSVGDWLRFDENGPLTQPVILVTTTADDSPKPKARNKGPALILNDIILTEVTAWVGPSLWGVTLLLTTIEAAARKQARRAWRV